MLATMEAQSGLGQAETKVQVRARMNRATAGQRHWWLSRAGRELWLLLRLRLGGALTALVVALVTAAAVAVGSDHSGRGVETQGFDRGFARGGGNMK